MIDEKRYIELGRMLVEFAENQRTIKLFQIRLRKMGFAHFRDPKSEKLGRSDLTQLQETLRKFQSAISGNRMLTDKMRKAGVHLKEGKED